MIFLSLQDIIHLLLIECEVAYLDISVENICLEGHAGGLRVLVFFGIVRAVDDLLGPNFIELDLVVYVKLGLPLVNFYFALKHDAIFGLKFQ